jgi:hypothetical protein
MTTHTRDLAGVFPEGSRAEFQLPDLGAATFPRSSHFLFIPVPRSGARGPSPAGVARAGRRAVLPPGAGGQAVRALAATARATAWLVAAGSARMTTRVPLIVFAVSLGAIQMTRQPEAARRVMSFCPWRAGCPCTGRRRRSPGCAWSRGGTGRARRPPASSHACPHLAARPRGARQARAREHGPGGEHLTLHGYNATDRMLGINVRHASAARHSRLFYRLDLYIESGSPPEGLFSPRPAHSPPPRRSAVGRSAY